MQIDGEAGMRFQSVIAKIAFVGFVLALVLGLTAAMGVRFHFLDLKIGLLTLLPLALLVGLVGVLSGVIWAITAMIRNSGAGSRWGLIGLIGAAITITPPLIGISKALAAPPIHDISTDIEYAPQFKALLPLRAGAVNGPEYDGPKTVKLKDGKQTTVAALQKKYYEDVIPYAILTKPDKLFWRALNAANDMGWHVVDFNAQEGRIEATDTSFWFGFTDDIVIRVRPAGKLGARLDIRSKSRVGSSDVGANAARIRAYIKRLKGA
jgi:hypothetical protein